MITAREEWVIELNIKKLRKQEGNFSCHRIRAESGLHHVSSWTVNRMLKRMGYRFMEVRRKAS